MPEIGEVARIVHYIRQNLVGKTLAVVKAQHDENVFGKVGTSAAEFEKALAGKEIMDAKQQGKYFWLEMSTPPHPLCHFGMAGWFKIRNVETAYYKPTKAASDEWPPKYWKFSFETLEEPGKPVTEAAFVDYRRFARVRLIDCPAKDLRNTTPLKENGPDPVVDKDILTVEWLAEKCSAKRIPIKALLLDQANISGIGNWVGDEILYDAKIHPEQYSNTLSDSQISQLHKSIHYVCLLAVENKADSSKFPEEWLFKHRWGKGKKDSANRLPNGAKIVFITVGGRTSAVVPSVQKKTGKVAGDVKEEDKEDDEVDGLDDVDESDTAEEPAEAPKRTKKSTIGKQEAKENVSSRDASKRHSRTKRQQEQSPAAEAEVKSVPLANGSGSGSKKRKSDAKAVQEAESNAVDKTAILLEPVARAKAETEAPPAKKQKSAIKPSSRTAGHEGSGRSAGKGVKALPTSNKVSDGRRRSARVSAVDAQN